MTDWDRARCLTVDPDMFFPDVGDTAWQAKTVCRRCPIMDDCRDYGLSVPPYTYMGVYGALSERERRDIRAGRLTEAEVDARDGDIVESGGWRAWSGVRGGEARRRAAQRRAVECGEPSAYQRHRRNDEEPCDACAEAYRTYQREHKRRQAAKQRGEAA